MNILYSGFAKRGARLPLKPDFAEACYGDHPRQRLDFWKPETEAKRPAPAVIFFHGGGFLRGKKYHARVLREMRALGAATVAANYRFVRRRGLTVEDAMRDGTAVVRFVRAQADEWNIDPDRIALTGNSGGGCIAQWVTLTEPGLRGAATWNAPTSMDPFLLVREIGARSIIEYWPFWALYFDVLTIRALRKPETQTLIEWCSPLNRVHAGAPPLFLEYAKDLVGSRRIGWMDALHSARYGELMRDRYEQLGLRCDVKYPDSSGKVAMDRIEFLRDVLQL